MHAVSNSLISLESDSTSISTVFSSLMIGTCQRLRWLYLEKEVWRHCICLTQFNLIQIKLEGNILVDDFLLLWSIPSHLAKIFLVITRRWIGVGRCGRILAQICVWVTSDWQRTLGGYGGICWSDLARFNHCLVGKFVLLCVLWLWLVTWILIDDHFLFISTKNRLNSPILIPFKKYSP